MSLRYGLELTSDQISAFDRYYELLVEWNEKINLTAIIEPREVAIKHIVDSLKSFTKLMHFPPVDDIVLNKQVIQKYLLEIRQKYDLLDLWKLVLSHLIFL